MFTRSVPIRTYLLAFGLALLAPALVFAGLMLWQYHEAKEDSYERDAIELSRRITAVVDQRIEGVLRTLEALGTSGALRERRYAQLYEQARRIKFIIGSDVIVKEPSGQQVVNTQVPFGAALPVSLLDADRRAIETGKATISDVFVGDVAGRQIVSVNVPVVEDGRVVALIVSGIDLLSLSEFLNQQAVPAAWTAALVDKKGTIVARSRAARQFIGTTATQDLREKAVGKEGVWVGWTADRIPVLAAYTRSPLTEWRAAVGVPLSVVRAPLRNSLLLLGGLAAAIIAAFFVLANFLARHMSRSTARLAAAAAEMGAGRGYTAPDLSLRELQRLSETLSAAAQKLKDREEGFRAVFEQSSAGIARCDAEGRIQLANPHLCKLLGYRLPELAGRPVLDFVHAEDREAYRQLIRRMIGTGEGVQLEGRVVEKSGRVRWVDASISPLKGADGAIAGATIVAVDVTERREAERALKESAEILRVINEGTPTLLYAKDREGRVTMANPATLRAFAKEADAVIGRRAPENMPDPEGARQVIENDRRVMETGRAQTFEETIKLSGGTRVFLSTKVPLRDNAGAIVGVIGASMDITERKEAEERVKLLVGELDHRAKNMLAVVQGIVQLAQAPSVAEFKQSLQGRIQALAHAHALLSASGWKGADFRRLLEDELAPYRGLKSQRIRLSGPDVMLPPAAAQALAIVIHELATNAVKHGALSAEGGGVRLEWSRPSDAILLITWLESGGPPVIAPQRLGFGSRVMQRLAGQLDGTASIEWLPDGIRCQISVRID